MTPTAPIGSLRPPPNVNPSPRQRFQESSQSISHHRELIQRNEFQRALDYAVLHMQWVMAKQEFKDFNGVAANQMKMVGVHEFIAIFKTLAEPPPTAIGIIDRDNLNQNT
jgi:hypothetical protein